MNTEPIIPSSEDLRLMRQMRFNPIAQLTARSLNSALEAFAMGNLRLGAQLFEIIAERDDTIPGVKGKREKEVSQLGFEVVADVKTATAESHKEALEDFWRNVRAVNAYDRAERGGFKRLVKQMMRAVSFRYACHHLVWRPRPDRLRATFEYVPLHLFENTTGSMRYLRDPYSSLEGEVMPGDEWMVTASDGLMIPASIGYFFKRDGINTWAIFCHKFSVPGIVGATSAAQGSPEGEAMKAGVESYANDFAAVLYGVEDPAKLPIHLIQPNGNPSAMPQPAMVERVDRKLASLWRGSDLSTMSSTDGEGTGASLQGDETDLLTADDASTIEETLAEVSSQVIEWYFGRGVEPLARVCLKVKEKKGKAEKQTAAGFIADRGGRVSLTAVAEELDVPLADEGELVLSSAEGAGSREESEERVMAENAMRHFSGPEAWEDFREAVGLRRKKLSRWMEFSPDSRSLGIPRREMPQIAGGDRAAFLSFLKARRVKCVTMTVKASELKPSQDGFSPAKVSVMREEKAGRRRVLISSDYYLVDGHHQWLASLGTGLEEIEVVMVTVPIVRALGLAHAFPSSKMERGANAVEEGSDEEKFAESARSGAEAALVRDLEPVLELLNRARESESVEERNEILGEANEVMEGLELEGSAEAYEEILASALVNGWSAAKEENE